MDELDQHPTAAQSFNDDDYEQEQLQQFQNERELQLQQQIQQSYNSIPTIIPDEDRDWVEEERVGRAIKRRYNKTSSTSSSPSQLQLNNRKNKIDYGYIGCVQLRNTIPNLQILHWKLNLMAVSNEHRLLFIAELHSLSVFDLDNPQTRIKSIHLNNNLFPINQIRIGKLDGEEVVVAVDDGGFVRIIVTRDLDRDPVCYLNEGSSTWGIAICPTRPLVAVSANNFKIVCWDLSSEDPHYNRKTYQGHKHNIPCIDFSPCGRFLVSVSIDKFLRVWDVENQSTLLMLRLSQWGWACRWIDVKASPTQNEYHQNNKGENNNNNNTTHEKERKYLGWIGMTHEQQQAELEELINQMEENEELMVQPQEEDQEIEDEVQNNNQQQLINNDDILPDGDEEGHGGAILNNPNEYFDMDEDDDDDDDILDDDDDDEEEYMFDDEEGGDDMIIIDGDEVGSDINIENENNNEQSHGIQDHEEDDDEFQTPTEDDDHQEYLHTQGDEEHQDQEEEEEEEEEEQITLSEETLRVLEELRQKPIDGIKFNLINTYNNRQPTCHLVFSCFQNLYLSSCTLDDAMIANNPTPTAFPVAQTQLDRLAFLEVVPELSLVIIGSQGPARQVALLKIKKENLFGKVSSILEPECVLPPPSGGPSFITGISVVRNQSNSTSNLPTPFTITLHVLYINGIFASYQIRRVSNALDITSYGI